MDRTTVIVLNKDGIELDTYYDQNRLSLNEKAASMSVSPFDFVEAVSFTKEDIIRDGDAEERDYNAFIVNKALSFFPDSVFDSQEMNREYMLDPIMQFDYLRLSLRKRKRFSKWFKKINNEI